METIVVVCAVVATATFVVKTIVSWIKSGKYEKEAALRRKENETRRATFAEARLNRLEEKLKEKENVNEDIDW